MLDAEQGIFIIVYYHN